MNATLIGRMEQGYRLWYRTPSTSVAGLLPAGLELVTRGPWAFWSVTIGTVRGARWCEAEGEDSVVKRSGGGGMGFGWVSYGLLTQAMTEDATIWRGVYVVRTEAGATAVDTLGSTLSDWRLRPAEITRSEAGLSVVSSDGIGDTTLTWGAAAESWPMDSCFPTPLDADTTLRPSARTLTSDGRTLRIIDFRAGVGPPSQGSPRAWQADAVGPTVKLTSERSVGVSDARFGPLRSLGQDRLTLERARRHGPIAGRWEYAERRLLGARPWKPREGRGEIDPAPAVSTRG